MDIIPKVQVTLLGRTWEFTYDLQTVFAWDRQTGKTFFLLKWSELKSEDWAAMVWAGIRRHDPTLTFERFVSEVSPFEAAIAVGLVMQAVILGSPGKDSEQPDPTTASPTGTG